MRLALLGALAIASPVGAQDHSAHRHHAMPQEETPEPMDHCAMGHLPPEQCPPPDAEAAVDHSQMDHAAMGHSAMGQPEPDHSQMDHAAMGHSMAADKSAPGAASEAAIPPRALEGPRHAADAIWGEAAMAPARAGLARENGGMRFGTVLVERLELRVPTEGGAEAYLWDVQGWFGGDIDKFVLKSEGEGEFSHGLEDAEVQALWGHAIGPFVDLQAGVRLDVEPETRSHAVLGLQGLAPYMLHFDAALFLSDRGDLTARLEAEYDQKLTQRLILQPRFEIEAAAQDIPERGIGAGLTKIEPGLRLRYEIVPEFAPYLGIEYEARLGETADIARAEGEDAAGFRLLAGLRFWF